MVFKGETMKKNDKPSQHDESPELPGDGPASPDEGVEIAPGNAEGISGGPAIPSEEAANLLRQVDELKSKLLRATADYQNMIRRSQLNITEAREQQLIEIAKSLVTVMDHFDRALAVDIEKVPVQTMLQGMQIVHDELFKVLEQLGIQRIEAKPGEEFDPKRHAALMRQKIEGIPAGRVAAQFQPGYIINDRTLRPVQVSVAE